MSAEYDLYLEQHKANVRKGFEWLRENLPGIITNYPFDSPQIEHLCVYSHDASKSDPEEYEAYDAYFYGGNRSYEVVQNFQRAWLRHIHKNPHHWQHWILYNDNPGEGMVILDMPYPYIVEMICDWWSFSWKSGDLTEIFKFYEERKDYIELSKKTRQTVEWILISIAKTLLEKDLDMLDSISLTPIGKTAIRRFWEV